MKPDWSAWSNWSDCSATCGQNSTHYRYRTCLNGESRKIILEKSFKITILGVDVIENEFCAGRNRIEAPCTYVPCPVIGPGVPLAPHGIVPEIDPEEEIEDPYSNEKKEPDEEIPDITRPSSDPKLSSVSPPTTVRVSSIASEADETTVTQSIKATTYSTTPKITTGKVSKYTLGMDNI